MTRLASSPFLAFALCLLTAAVFWLGLSGGFLFDDFPNILTNARIQITQLNLESLAVAAKAYAGPIGRPLATISFAIDHVIGGKNPWGYKVTSLLVHLLNALLVFRLLLSLWSLPRIGGTQAKDMSGNVRLALFAITLLWAIHPLQVSTVLYVVQRMEMLCLTSVLLALLAYMKGRTKQLEGERAWPWLAASALLAASGMLSKESAILFPAYTLALELAVLRFDAKDAETRRALRLAYGFGAAVAVVLFLTVILPRYATPSAYAVRDFTLGERLLTQLRVLPLYIGQMLLPLPGSMTFYYDDYLTSTGFFAPASTAAGAVFLASLLGVAFRMRERLPLFSLGIFWFFAAHLLTSSVIPLEQVFEHRNYFALLGVLLAVADLVRRIPMKEARLAQVIVLVLIVGIGMLGALRSATWGNPLLLATDLSAKNPDSARASTDLGEQYMILANGSVSSPFYGFAQLEFERGSRLPSASPLPEQGLILMAALSGQPVQDAWWDRVVHKLRVRAVGPEESMMVLGLLGQRYKGVPLDDRRLADVYTVLAERSTMPPLQYVQLGDHALRYLKDPALADRMFVSAIEQCRNDPAYARKLIAGLASDGYVRQATVAAAKAEELGLVPRGTFPTLETGKL